jgi:hypothetical protein
MEREKDFDDDIGPAKGIAIAAVIGAGFYILAWLVML